MTTTEPTPRPWPAMQALLPPLTGSQLELLRESIRDAGVQTPIVLCADGKIIDGHNRYAVAEELGVPCPTMVTTLNDEAAMARGIMLNLARRQLDAAGVAHLRDQLRNSVELQVRTAIELRRGGMNHDEIAATVGFSRSTITRWLQAARALGEETEGVASNVQTDNGSHLPDIDNRRHHSPEKVAAVKNGLAAGASERTVARQTGVSRGAVQKIAKRQAAPPTPPVLPARPGRKLVNVGREPTAGEVTPNGDRPAPWRRAAVLLTAFIYSVRTVGGPRILRLGWSPDEMRDFTAKLRDLRVELDALIAGAEQAAEAER